MAKKIIILDFGSQYTQLIARKVRELRYYAEIYPYNISEKELRRLDPGAIILSGGPSSVYEKKAPKPKAALFDYDLPVLGICYGLQYLCHAFGGKVEDAAKREYGKANLSFTVDDQLAAGLPAASTVWMSHGDRVAKLPTDFLQIAETENSPLAIVRHKKKPIYGVQFHPEVHHSKYGKTFLKNFCELTEVKKNWSMAQFAKLKIKEIQQQVGNERVLLGLSGGVDSTVTARLLHEAVGSQLSCVYVDTGLMRAGETEAVINRFKNEFQIPLHVVKAGNRFIKALAGVQDPEAKRKIIGDLFLQEFKKKSDALGHHEFLAQGTLYTDVIESVSVKGPSQTIKSHHNRVSGVLELIKAGRVVEPLKELFKDEVRRLGLALKISRESLFRHPFPGPGLAIRILGEVNKKALDLLRQADTILLEELKSSRYYDKTWQAFAVFLPVKAVGVMGDKRTYENVIALRLVSSMDGMTADFSRVPYAILAKISSRIINEIPGINRVVYDISSKPPATIEWE